MDTDEEEGNLIAIHDMASTHIGHDAAPDTESEGEEGDGQSISAEDLSDLHQPIQHSQSLKDLENIDDSEANAIFEHVRTALQIISSGDTEPEAKAAIVTLKDDYERLRRIVLESRDHTRNLAKRATGMITAMTDNSIKIKSIVSSHQNDKLAARALRKELKRNVAVVEACKKREAEYLESINELRNELLLLRANDTDDTINRDGTILNYGKTRFFEMQREYEDKLKRSIKIREELEAEYQKSQAQIKALKSEIESGNSKIAEADKDRAYIEEEMKSLKEYLNAKKGEQDREVRARERVEKDLEVSQTNIEQKEYEIRIKSDEIKLLKESLNKLEIALESERSRNEEMANERETIYSQQVALQQECEEQTRSNEQLQDQISDLSLKLTSWEEEVSRLRQNHKASLKEKNALNKKLKLLEEENVASNMERDTLRSTNAHLTRDLETTKKELELTAKNFEIAARERDISQKNYVKSTTASVKQYSLLKLSDQSKRNLEQEITGYKDEAQKMRKLIFTLEKDRDHRMGEVAQITQELSAREEEIKMRDISILDSKKKNSEYEKKLKEQQVWSKSNIKALYESVRTDRNVYSKNLLESQDELMEMKRKLKIMNHQVEQLKEEIGSRESVLIKEQFEHTKLEKEKEALLLQIGKLNQIIDESRQTIQNQQGEEHKLRSALQEAELEKVRAKKDYEAVVQERDMLGTQLIRKNDELSLIYEKVKITTSTFNKGEIQYRERLEDIRVLRLEVKKLRREKIMLQTEALNIENLRAEIFRLQKDILRERTRVKVLEEELESPMNIHRWRKLEGSDPSMFELISKIQTLQKRLIQKTEEVVEKELVISQKDKLYNQVKKVLQRQPGPEVLEELESFRATLKSKVRESKVFCANLHQALASELNMYHSQVNEYKYEIDRLNRELQEFKSKYYQSRKKKQSGEENNFHFIGSVLDGKKEGKNAKPLEFGLKGGANSDNPFLPANVIQVDE